MPGAFTFDPNRCTGCRACELACSIENGLGVDRSWRHVITFNEQAVAGSPRFHLSLACNHCAEPACMYACPALAYGRDASTGAVLLDPDRCIGCRYCAWACPYGAPTFETERGVMGKCTFCSHRLSDGLKPACATLCPTGALDYEILPPGDLMARVPGFPQTDLRPSIRIREPRHRSVLEPIGETGTDLAWESAGSKGPEISLRSEGSLASFTFLVSLLVGAFVASLGGALSLPPLVFAAGAAIAGALSLSHLGRPERAWRAGLNLRRSWLSREVVGFGLFAAGGTALLAIGRPAPVPGGLVLAVGLMTLYAADQVYRPVYRGRDPVLAPGGVLLTGLYVGGLLLGSFWLAAPLWSLKAIGEFRRWRTRSAWRVVPTWLEIMRVALGLVLPAAAWFWTGAHAWPGWVVGGAIGGEALARIVFYLELRVRSPARQAREDLARAVELTTA